MFYLAHAWREDEAPFLNITVEYPEDLIKVTKPCGFQFNPIPI